MIFKDLKLFENDIFIEMFLCAPLRNNMLQHYFQSYDFFEIKFMTLSIYISYQIVI